MAKLPRVRTTRGAIERDLLVEVGPAGRYLLGPGVAVAGRAAFDHVGDVHLFPAQPGLLRQQAVEQLPGPAHERAALKVLVAPRPLPDDHEAGMIVALAEHHRRASLGQGAQGADRGDAFDVG